MALSNYFEIVNHCDGPIGIAIEYSKILTFTIERIAKQLSIGTTKFPVTIYVADGLDGLESYKVYNPVRTSIDF